MLARDQTTVLQDEPNVFGQEWQVLDSEPKLFSVARTPQYPETCLAPPTKMSAAHQRVLQEAALEKDQVRDVCAAWDEDEEDGARKRSGLDDDCRDRTCDCCCTLRRR